jgi:hypothetical protein
MLKNVNVQDIPCNPNEDPKYTRPTQTENGGIPCSDVRQILETCSTAQVQVLANQRVYSQTFLEGSPSTMHLGEVTQVSLVYLWNFRHPAGKAAAQLTIAT